MSVPTKYTQDAARNLIVKILNEGGDLHLTWHCEHDRMVKRNVSSQDIEYVLETGVIIKEPEWDYKCKDWKYSVEGMDLEGDSLTVVSVIITQAFAIRVITVY